MAVDKIALGMLNKRVVFMIPDVTVNEAYGRDIDYRDNFTVWAHVRQKSGYRNVEARVSGSESTFEFFVRHSVIMEAVGKNWLMRYGGKLWTIQDIHLIAEERKLYKITATEREDWVK